MIVCSCNVIDHRQLEGAVDRLYEADPLGMLTPVLVYKTLDKRPRCGGCLSLAARMIHGRVECLRNCADCPLARMANIAPARENVLE